jgi:hypothetical protein
VVGGLRRAWWWPVGGRFRLQSLRTFRRNPCSGLARAGDDGARGCHYFLGSIVARCAQSCAYGLDSRGKPLISDQATEAMWCLFLVGGIVLELTVVRDCGMVVVIGLLCEVQVCSLAKMMSRAEDGSRRGFVSRFYPTCPMGSSALLCCCGVGAAVASLRR